MVMIRIEGGFTPPYRRRYEFILAERGEVIPRSEAESYLLSLARQEGDFTLKVGIIRAARKFHSQSMKDMIRGFSYDTHRQVRRYATFALSDYPESPDVLEDFERLSKDRVKTVRQAAIMYP